MKPKTSLIVSVTSRNSVIGDDNNLVVRISDDLKRFRQLTTGHPIIMGRKTYESIGLPLPNRTNIVISRNKNLKIDGVTICQNINDAFEKAALQENNSANENKEIFIIGGGEIYKQSLLYADRIYLTLVESDIEGSVTFPEYKQFTREISREDRVDEQSGLKYSWITLEK